eukprot:Skav228187  [mRNA]  locus=scaffold3933:467168:469780:+ [translate_table: standard]
MSSTTVAPGTGKSEKITITNDKGRLTEEQIEKMIREAEEFADEDKKVKERVDAKNAFDGYIHSMRSATEDGGCGAWCLGPTPEANQPQGSGDNKGLSEKMDSDEKEQILDALKDGSLATRGDLPGRSPGRTGGVLGICQSWLDSNPEADAEEIKEKHKEIEGLIWGTAVVVDVGPRMVKHVVKDGKHGRVGQSDQQ